MNPTASVRCWGEKRTLIDECWLELRKREYCTSLTLEDRLGFSDSELTQYKPRGSQDSGNACAKVE